MCISETEPEHVIVYDTMAIACAFLKLNLNMT